MLMPNFLEAGTMTTNLAVEEIRHMAVLGDFRDRHERIGSHNARLQVREW